MAFCTCFEFSYSLAKDILYQIFPRLITLIDLLLLCSWSPVYGYPEPSYPLTDWVIYTRVVFLNVLIFAQKSSGIWPDLLVILLLGISALYAVNILFYTGTTTLAILAAELLTIVWSPDRRRQRRLWTHNATFRIASVWNPFQRSLRRSLLLPLVSRHNTPTQRMSIPEASSFFHTSVNTTKVVSSYVDVIPEGIVGHNAERRILHVHVLHAEASKPVQRRIVFLHQFGSGAFTWHSVMTLLSKYPPGKLVAFDRIAHGLTFASEPLSNFDECTPLSEDLNEVVNFTDAVARPLFEASLIDWVTNDDDGLPTYLVTCGGAGASLAIEYAQTHPVAGIVFISPYLLPTDGVPSVLRSVASAAVGRALTVSMAKTEVTSLIPRRSWESEVPDTVLQAYARSVDVPGWEDAMIQFLRKPVTVHDFSSACANIRCLVIGGDSDHFVSAVDEYALFAASIGAPYLSLSNCGASPQEERPELVADILTEFVTA